MERLECANHFQTVAIAQECMTDELLCQMSLIGCKNIVVIGPISNEFLRHNFNFYLRNKTNNNSTSENIFEYNLEIHSQLFKYVSDYDILNNFVSNIVNYVRCPILFSRETRVVQELITHPYEIPQLNNYFNPSDTQREFIKIPIHSTSCKYKYFVRKLQKIDLDMQKALGNMMQNRQRAVNLSNNITRQQGNKFSSSIYKQTNAITSHNKQKHYPFTTMTFITMTKHNPLKRNNRYGKFGGR